jgi:sterol desaturase/sphingolipid hydroxylase (fatty acid hydroxylase superfamily)
VILLFATHAHGVIPSHLGAKGDFARLELSGPRSFVCLALARRHSEPGAAEAPAAKVPLTAEIDLADARGQSPDRPGNPISMRLNSKTTSCFAVASAIVLAGLAIAWYEIRRAPVQAADAAQFVYTHSYDLLKSIGSTTAGRVGVVVAVVLLAEIFFVGWRRSSLFRLLFVRSRSAMLDLLNLMLMLLKWTVFLEIALTLGASFVTSKFIDWITSQYGWSRITLPSDGMPGIAASLAVFWLATSFAQYWGHRLSHTPALWHLHRFHHAATELNMVSAYRQHPLEGVALRFLSLVSPLAFFEVSQRVLLLYFILYTVSDLLAHSQLPWGYGWIGRWIVQSPLVHQVHHSIDDEHQNLHFSFCPLWDHLFGTWYKGTKRPSRFGIADPAYELRPLRTFVLDAWTFYAGIGRWACSLPRKLGMTSADPPSAVGMSVSDVAPPRGRSNS